MQRSCRPSQTYPFHNLFVMHYEVEIPVENNIDVQGIFVRLSEWVMFVSFQVDSDI